MFFPSIFRLLSSLPPAKLAKVGSRSIDVTISSEAVPAGMAPGQRIKNGTRWPPSHVEPLPAFSGLLLAP